MANRLSSSIFAPVTFVDGAPVSGLGWFVQLYAGPTGTSEDSLVAVYSPIPFRTGAAAGAWIGTELTVPGVAAGATAAMQARVMFLEEGIIPWDGPVILGKSVVFTSLPLGGGNPPLPAPNIVGNPDPLNNLQPFSVVPEPSVVALSGLGALALLLRRRRT